MPCKVTLQFCDMIKCVREKQCYNFNTRSKKHESFGGMGKGLMKVAYFTKRLWNVCGCHNLIIELPIASDSITNYFPCIVGYMQCNHVGNHL